MAHTNLPLVIADRGASPYRIVRPAAPSPVEEYAAAELQAGLEQVCGARLPILADDGPPSDREIILGDSAHLPPGVAAELARLGDEGYVLRTGGGNLIIAGGRRRGTLYGVYGLLEDHLGCRWFTPEVSRYPKHARLEIGPLDERVTPALEYREVFYHDARDGDWAARNRLNSSMAGLEQRHGGKVTYHPFVHSYYTLFPPDQYFEKHPEWYSLVDGKRTVIGRHRRAQLCLTNEEMTRAAIEIVRGWLAEHPEATIVSISQNDGPGGWCECPDCAALEAREGGAHSAPIIHFANRIAGAIAADHPHVAIDTLAYGYSMAAPARLRPLPNVIVRICTGACGCHPIASEKCASNSGLRATINDWFRLTNRIYIWDYIVNFRQYFLPFPNLGTLGANLRFFVEHGVRGVFEQGSGDVPGSDLAALKAWLVAKLLWDPYADQGRLVKEFTDSYYGPAAAPIRAYLAALQAEVDSDTDHRLHMSPFAPGVEAPYLTPGLLRTATGLFDEAERLAAADPAVLLRVRAARLSLDYVKVSLAARLQALLGDGGRQPFDQWCREAIDGFFGIAEQAGFGHVREASRHRSTMAEFREDLGLGGRAKEGDGAEIE